MVVRSLGMPHGSAQSIEQIHLFDLDHTLLSCNSSLRFAAYLYEQKAISRSALLKCAWRFCLYSLGLSTIGSQMEALFCAFFQARPCEEVLRHLDPFWRQLQNELRPCLLARLRWAQQQGHLCGLFSASPDFLVNYVAMQLGIPLVLASEYGNDGKLFTALGHVASGRSKAQALKRLRCRFQGVVLYGYSDSLEDCDFLQGVDHAWLVAPSWRLLRWAKQFPHIKVWPTLGRSNPRRASC